jgi:hypothetical protein
MTHIDTIEQWCPLAGELREAGYHLSQFQYSWYEPAGFHAWFWCSKRPEVEIVTHSEVVQEAIVEFNGGK